METDTELIKRIRSGEREVYGELFRKYYGQIHALCLCILKSQQDADETTQDTFIHAYLKLDQLQEPARFFPWPKRIAQNLTKDHIRQTHIVQIPMDSVCPEADSDIPDEQLLRQELMDAIMDAIELLPIEDRVVSERAWMVLTIGRSVNVLASLFLLLLVGYIELEKNWSPV